VTNLIAHIREVIDEHGRRDAHGGAGISCDCGATNLSDHASHVAQAIVDRLEQRLESLDNRKKVVSDKVRTASALIDQELTILEGAE
jgi:hypothetical protein